MTKSTQQTYDLTAETYAQKVADLHPTSFAQRFLSLLPKRAKIIDVGCGSGRDAKIFSEMGHDVTGIDFSAKMIQVATKAAPKAHFHVMDIRAIDLPANTFDGAWASASLLHIAKSDIPTVLTQICQLLKPQGSLHLSVKKGRGEVLENDQRYGNLEKFWSFFSVEELEDFLKKNGFDVLEICEAAKQSDYETHPMLHAYAQKPPER